MKLLLRFVLFALLLFVTPARAEIKGDTGPNIRGESVEVRAEIKGDTGPNIRGERVELLTKNDR